MRLIPILALLSACALAHTADYRFDLRLDLAIVPGVDEIELDYKDLDAPADESFSGSQDVGVKLAPGLF